MELESASTYGEWRTLDADVDDTVSPRFYSTQQSIFTNDARTFSNPAPPGSYMQARTQYDGGAPRQQYDTGSSGVAEFTPPTDLQHVAFEDSLAPMRGGMAVQAAATSQLMAQQAASQLLIQQQRDQIVQQQQQLQRLQQQEYQEETRARPTNKLFGSGVPRDPIKARNMTAQYIWDQREARKKEAEEMRGGPKSSQDVLSMKQIQVDTRGFAPRIQTDDTRVVPTNTTWVKHGGSQDTTHGPTKYPTPLIQMPPGSHPLPPGTTIYQGNPLTMGRTGYSATVGELKPLKGGGWSQGVYQHEPHKNTEHTGPGSTGYNAAVWGT